MDADFMRLIGEGVVMAWAVWRAAQALERVALSAERIADAAKIIAYGESGERSPSSK